MYKELKGYESNMNQGYVYILFNKESNLIKIGKTKNPNQRFRTLSNQTGSILKYYISEPMYIEGIIERIMQNKYNRFRVKGEWFKNIDFDTVKKDLIDLCNSENFKERNKI